MILKKIFLFTFIIFHYFFLFLELHTVIYYLVYNKEMCQTSNIIQPYSKCKNIIISNKNFGKFSD